MPANVELFSPSRRAWANAKSRFGPVTPFVPARASVWHAPQRLTNIFLPLSTFAFDVDPAPQPEAAAATATHPPSARRLRTDTASSALPAPPLSMAADPNA